MKTRTQAPPAPTTDHATAPPLRVRRGRHVLAWSFASLLVVIAVVWAGLRIQPEPFDDPELEAPVTMPMVPLPDGLPAPVERFYRTLYGDQVPLVESAVITGRGTMRINGITLPARFRFSHVAGHDYRHHIENTFFGLPLLTVNERFVDDTARLELPFGAFEGPKIDQAANLNLWAETVFMPSVWITDPQATWAPIDEASAHLIVPFGDQTETFKVTFDPGTGLLRRMESMRFKSEEDEAKTLWINDVHEWGEIHGRPAPLATSLTWADEATPWAKLRTEDVLHNADLTRYVRASGP
jgi:hypothetical protein